jgi:hypothetical protein
MFILVINKNLLFSANYSLIPVATWRLISLQCCPVVEALVSALIVASLELLERTSSESVVHFPFRYTWYGSDRCRSAHLLMDRFSLNGDVAGASMDWGR